MTLGDFTRWLYRGQRPNWIARILNRASAVVDGQRYLVSMLGDSVHWVHNVRAAGGRADQRAPILRAYLQRAPGARPHVPVNKDVTPPEFEKIAAAFPVFRVASQ